MKSEAYLCLFFLPNWPFLWLLNLALLCPGGAGRYRAEALQELAAQFGQTFGLQ